MCKTTPADDGTAEAHERFVDVVAFVKARAKASELMEQGDGLLGYPAEDAQAAAVIGVASSDVGGNVPAGQLHTVLFRVIGPVALHKLGLSQRRSNLAANRR